MDPEIEEEIAESAPRQNAFQRLLGICFDPRETLQGIARHPTWVFPLLLSLILVSIPLVLQVERVPREIRAKAQAEQAVRFVSGQEVKTIQQRILSQPETAWTKFSQVPWILTFGTLVTLAVVGVVLGAFLLSGCQLTYRNALAAYCWSTFPPTLLAASLAVLFLYAKDPSDLNPLDPLSNIISHLGILADEKGSPVLHSFLNSFDIFSFWRIYMLGLGLSLAASERTSLAKAITIITVLWLFYVLGKVGITAILY